MIPLVNEKYLLALYLIWKKFKDKSFSEFSFKQFYHSSPILQAITKADYIIYELELHNLVNTELLEAEMMLYPEIGCCIINITSKGKQIINQFKKNDLAKLMLVV